MTRTLIAAAILATGLAGQALAHAHLQTTVPAANTVAEAPLTLELRFSEGVEPKFSKVMLHGADGRMIETGAPAVSDAGKTLTVPLKAALPAGRYGVMWQVLSVDGHKMQGDYSFDVK